MVFRISLAKLLDKLPAFNCAITIYHLWSICLGVNVLSSLAFCCLLKSVIFSKYQLLYEVFHSQEFPFINIISLPD